MSVKLAKVLLALVLGLFVFTATPKDARAQWCGGLSRRACYTNWEWNGNDFVVEWNLPCWNAGWSIWSGDGQAQGMVNCGLKTIENFGGSPVLRLTVGYSCRPFAGGINDPNYFGGPWNSRACEFANLLSASFCCYW